MMANEKFRRQLREESLQWRQEGLIEASQYDQLVRRYHFDQLAQEPDNRFIGILLGLGGILLGLGVITFVAANWQVWSRIARLILLLVLFLGVNSTGFYLWRQPRNRNRFHRLGHGLLLTGGLILGANLGLMSQMFHQSGPVYQLFLIWGVGVLAMAYGLRLVSLGILSWILIMLSYWNFAFEKSLGAVEWAFFPQVMLYLPLLISLFYLPLAHGLRSRSVYGLWGLSLIILLWRSLSFGILAPTSPWLVALAFILPTALLWVYRMDWRQTRGSSRRDRFLPVGHSLALWSIGFPLYFCSFRFPWEYNPFSSDVPFSSSSILPAGIILVVYLATALYGCLHIRRQPLSFDKRWLTSPMMAVFLGLIYGLATMYSSGAFEFYGPILANLLLFGLSLILIHDGLVLNTRGKFWGGMSLLVLGLVHRIFEYNTDLTLKALVLSLCGLGVIMAGLWFERRLQQPALPEGE